MEYDEEIFIKNIVGKIIRNISIKRPSFFKHGYIEFIVEDPNDGDIYRAKINLG